ncbi:methylmalonyl-CoA mutase family protein [Ancylobacter terrae]|uniref:methylmalonyl-CoA mutase family protein n=1 Tax=Ancylobacter sp. sgz301288 TaxID=3342077 RepID=UPI003858CC63
MDVAALSAAFPPATRADWLALVAGVLKGGAYDKRMVTRTLDGLALDALPARRPQAQPIAGRAAGAPWRVIARIDHDDPDAANAQLLADLNGGADGAALVFASAPSARGFGLPATTDTLTRVLEGVMLDLVTLRVEAGQFRARDVALALAAYAEAHGYDAASLDLRFGLDPIGDFAALGGSMLDWEALATRLGQTVGALRSRGYGAPMVRADGRLHHAAGAGDAQELAAVLATAIAYLRALEAAGLTLEEAVPLIEATLTADVEQIATIAKLRALRLLWARALAACGLDTAPPLALHAETAWRSLTTRDPHVNLLRGTIAAFAAGTGGADSFTVLPFTEALGLPDAFARRLARNTQVMLIEESNVHRVADPGAGAGAIEEATEALAAAAWELFRQIERAGGMVEALASGHWQTQLAATRAARAAAVATRRQPITGTSEFPQLGAGTVAVLTPARADAPAAPADGALACEPLAPSRIAEPFERLRAAAERAATPPTVFLATLGSVAAFTARAGFARGLFEAGGIAATGGDTYASPAALAEAFRASGARLACLCSSDEIYAGEGEAAARALKAAGATALYLAGRPGEGEAAALRAAGVDEFVGLGTDLIDMLARAQARVGLR